jgi:CRISPR-associated protein Csb2
VPYLRQPNCFAAQPATPKPATTDSTKTKYTVARFALDGPVLPLVTETLPLAEAFRYQALGRFKGVMRRLHNLPQEADPKTEPRLRSRTLSGKDDEGHKLTGGHDHAFYLPSDEDGDGRIDHLTVYAAGRFTTEEVRALDSLRDLTLDENQLRLLLVGLGTQESFVSPVFGPSREWVSATPFLAPRHFKERGQKRDKGRIDGIDGRPTFIAGLLVEAWEVFCKGRTDLPAWDQVEVTPLERVAAREREFRALEFARTRPRKRGDDGYRRGFGLFRLRFPVAVRGPIVLGYHAHFGLGQWVAVPEAATPCTPPAGTGAGGRG